MINEDPLANDVPLSDIMLQRILNPYTAPPLRADTEAADTEAADTEPAIQPNASDADADQHQHQPHSPQGSHFVIPALHGPQGRGSLRLGGSILLRGSIWLLALSAFLKLILLSY